ncbi:MAG TPA: response regulator [Gemmataceae bacterium]|nr:response regulator [Gemmataceae bacterium]
MSEKTILIVEDNEVQREGLAVVLRKEGYNAVSAMCGDEAVGIVERVVRPDLILLDMMIPSPDGWRFMAMRKDNPALAAAPVVIVTALGVASPEWAESLGACGLIRKPVETAHLLAEVRRRLGDEPPA